MVFIYLLQVVSFYCNDSIIIVNVLYSILGYDKFAEELFKKLQSSTLGAPLDEF